MRGFLLGMLGLTALEALVSSGARGGAALGGALGLLNSALQAWMDPTKALFATSSSSPSMTAPGPQVPPGQQGQYGPYGAKPLTYTPASPTSYA